jgi:hypothetical protein
MGDTVKLKYSASSNISFRGEIDTGIPREEWAEMGDEEKDAIITEQLHALVDIGEKE